MPTQFDIRNLIRLPRINPFNEGRGAEPWNALDLELKEREKIMFMLGVQT